MKYGEIKYVDVLNGDGLRVSLFVSGCRNGCKGCFNKILKDFNFGDKFTNKEESKILETIKNKKINYSGVSLLGGDPFEEENAKELVKLAKKVKEANKSVWAWSGYTFEDIRNNKIKSELLKYIDILIDGKFIEEQRDLNLKYRGSLNQRVIDVKKSTIDKIVLYT
ncbi:MAG: anaerobic ribonucleoside-triphosphate reductase activating protein [Lachnospirales bacterium]